MLEPAGPWGGNDRGFEPDAAPGFLEALAAMTHDAGALLVFDEIITGYRYPQHSVQKARGLRPDVACLGKAFASGMPLSAVVGRRDVFERALPHCHYGPTFKGEALSLHAAKATIEVCRREPVAQHVWDHGERLRAGIERLCAAHRVDARMAGPPFRMAFLFREPDAARLLQLRTLLQQELLRAGLSTYNGVMLPSLAHDDAVLAETLRRFERALAVVAAAQRAGDLERRLEIPPLIDL
jgi:glutamate-1-semialdehyde aminotransferase